MIPRILLALPFFLFVGAACSDESTPPDSNDPMGGAGGEGDPGDPDPGALLDDVCEFEGATELAEPDGEGLRSVPPRHPHIWYMGRVDCEAADGPQFAFPGVSVRIKFEGTELRATIHDSGSGSATTTNYLDVVIDGGAPVVLEVTGASSEYVLAEGLSEGEHEVLLWKRTEASVGTMQIREFRMKGDKLLPAQGKERRLEFIGDSITCGYGNEVSTTMPDDFPFTSENENSHLAYGAVTADLLAADYMGVSYSGRGMSRNYAGGAGETVPQFYLDTLPDSGTAAAWDPSRYVADAVIINVGTNDFSTEGFDTGAYTQAYTEFLATLRGYYPDALFVAAIGPMLSDSYPPGAMSLTNAEQGIQDAISAREAEGDSNIVFVSFPPQTSPYGEDWHPTIETHAKMAQQLSEVLKAELGW